MRFRWRSLVAVSALVATGAVVACTVADESFRPDPVYAYDAATFDRAPPPPPGPDAAIPTLSCGDAGDAPPRLLVVNQEQPELVAFNLDTLTVDGRYSFDGGAGVTSSSANRDPWLVDRANDLVTRLDAREPWKPVATWDVHGNDGAGGSAPSVVVQVSCTKAYVLRANRDRIAIIDPSQSGGTPTGFVDLSSFHAPGDPGLLELVSAVWVPAKKKVFVLAGNIDPAATSEPFGLACTALKPTVFAIDVATDAVVSLAGKGPAGSIELAGYDAISLLYDAPFDRLVALSAGCHAGDGAAQPQRRVVEQVDLATGTVKTLLTFGASPRPSGLTLLDGDHAVVTFGTRGSYWNPHEAALGPEIAGPLELAALDGNGGLAGSRRLADGGFELVGLPLDFDAGAGEGPRVLVADPFSTAGGRAASLEPWPHR